MVVKVLGIGQRFEQPPALVEGYLSLPAVSHARPRLRLLGEELNGNAVVRGDLRPVPGCRHNTVVVAGCEVDPGAHLVRPRDDLPVIRLSPERQRGLAGCLRSVPAARVVLDASHEKRCPACQDQDFAVLPQGKALSLK